MRASAASFSALTLGWLLPAIGEVIVLLYIYPLDFCVLFAGFCGKMNWERDRWAGLGMLANGLEVLGSVNRKASKGYCPKCGLRIKPLKPSVDFWSKFDTYSFKYA